MIKYAAVAQVVERSSEKAEVISASLIRGTKSGRRIVVITRRCQRRNGGSTPLARLPLKNASPRAGVFE